MSASLNASLAQGSRKEPRAKSLAQRASRKEPRTSLEQGATRKSRAGKFK